jgi:hypothetical protein
MLRKIKSAQKGPSWLEVGLGAALSVALGIVLGAAYMINKPVTKVTSIPKDAAAGAVYLVEGAKDLNKNAVMDERRAFVGGESVVVDESELNAFFASLAKPLSVASAPAKPGDTAPPTATPDQKILQTSAVNARIRDGKIQFSDTATLNVLGVTVPVIVQSSGVFRKSGSEWEFDPDTIYVGGCPMQRMLFFRGLILRKLLFGQPAPDDLAAAWSKLVDVSIDGSKLKLKAP